MFGGKLFVESLVTLANSYYLTVANPNVAGTLYNNIGIYIEDMTAGNDKNYGIYQKGNPPWGSDEDFLLEPSSYEDGVELGRGDTDTDITYIKLKNEEGEDVYIYPNEDGDGLEITTIKP